MMIIRKNQQPFIDIDQDQKLHHIYLRCLVFFLSLILIILHHLQKSVQQSNIHQVKIIAQQRMSYHRIHMRKILISHMEQVVVQFVMATVNDNCLDQGLDHRSMIVNHLRPLFVIIKNHHSIEIVIVHLSHILLLIYP